MSTVSVPAGLRNGLPVRCTNGLYAELGVGRVQKVRALQAKVEFNPSVFRKPPYRSENKILPLAELERVDAPPERVERAEWEEPWRFELKMLAARFLTGNKGGQLSNARTEILPHQVFAAYRVVSSPRRRFLLADEVGLGKTVEVGMVWQALYQRGQAPRTLIITPAGLATQWQEEMREKFGAAFEVFGRDFLSVNPRVWDLKATAIASLDTLKRAEHKRTLLENRRWNLIVFDEAHRLSKLDYESGDSRKTQNYALAEELRKYCDALLLVTATPHQGEDNHSRFRNLLLLLEDAVDFSRLWDSSQHELFGMAERTGGPDYTELVVRTPKKDVTDASGHKIFKGRQTHRLPFDMYADERRFYSAVENYIRTGYNALGKIFDGAARQAAGFVLATFQKLNASSTAAVRHALGERRKRLAGELPPPKPEAHDGTHDDDRYEGELFERKLLQHAVEIVKGEIAVIDSLLTMRVKRDKKLDVMLDLLACIDRESPRGRDEKVLIFTEYRKTQEYVVKELEARYGRGSVVVIHGDMKLDRGEDYSAEADVLRAPLVAKGAMGTPFSRKASQRLFRDHTGVRFLVSTEAGGEGINLQHCHIVMNCDVPWNPMRVEQRVGRVYRFGQDKVVQVYNYYNRGTIAERIQTYFEERIKHAANALSKVTGEDPEEIMGSLNGQVELDLDEVYRRALVDGNLNPETKKEIAEAVKRAQRAYDIATRTLFRDASSYSFDSYRRELATELTLDDLRKFTTSFLIRHHRQVKEDDGFMQFLVPAAIADRVSVDKLGPATFDRETAIRRPDVQFLALGHEFIDAMLSFVGSYDFGGLAARRKIAGTELAGTRGYHFNFIRRQSVGPREEGDDYLFSFHAVFVTEDGRVDEAAASRSVAAEGEASPDGRGGDSLARALAVARQHLEGELALWDWDEQMELLNASWVEFV